MGADERRPARPPGAVPRDGAADPPALGGGCGHGADGRRKAGGRSRLRALHGVLGMEGQPFEIIQPFAKESARMLGIEAGEDYEMFLRGVDGMSSLVKDNPDAILAYLEREDIRDGVIKKPVRVETPDPERNEPDPVSSPKSHAEEKQ